MATCTATGRTLQFSPHEDQHGETWSTRCTLNSQCTQLGIVPEVSIQRFYSLLLQEFSFEMRRSDLQITSKGRSKADPLWIHAKTCDSRTLRCFGRKGHCEPSSDFFSKKAPSPNIKGVFDASVATQGALQLKATSTPWEFLCRYLGCFVVCLSVGVLDNDGHIWTLTASSIAYSSPGALIRFHFCAVVCETCMDDCLHQRIRRTRRIVSRDVVGF